MKPKSLALLLTLFAVGGCGLTEQPDGSTPVPSSAPVATAPSAGSRLPLSIIVLSDDTGALPDDLVVGCPSGPHFPYGVLAGLSNEDERPELIEAIQPFLAGEEGQFWPQDGWKVLVADDEEATLVTLGDDGLAFMFLTRAEGVWSWSGSQMGSAECPLQYVTPQGLNTVEWRLDPSSAPMGADTTQVSVLLTERECVSGQPIGSRLVGPQIVMTGSEVRLAFAAVPPPGEAFDCQGNPETPYIVSLPEAIGDRVVIEGYGIGVSLEDFLG